MEVPTEERNIHRGHRSLQDLVNTLASGRVHALTPIGGRRDENGRYTQISFNVTFYDGSTRTYRLNQLQTSRHNLMRLKQLIEDNNIDYLPDPSLDVFGRGLRYPKAPNAPEAEAA